MRTTILITVAVLLSPMLVALVALTIATAVILLPILCVWGVLTDWCQPEDDYDY